MERQTGKTMKMKYAKLGKTDIEVSRICVGCMSYGKASDDFQPWTLPLEESTKMIAHALDLGVNFFDTANCYSHGTSEEYLGAALKSLGVARDKVVLASKVYFNDGHLSKDAIAREIEGTLRRLGTDYLDLYQIHRFDYATPIEETMAAMDKLVKSGKVRAIGASAMYGYQFHNMQIAAERKYGVSLIPYSPLAGGHLTHPEWDSPSKRAQTDKVLHAKYDSTKEGDMVIVKRVAELASRLGVTMSEVALAWHLAKGVTAPIVGATNAAHFDDAVRSVELTLSPDDIKFLEEAYRAHEVKGALPAVTDLNTVLAEKAKR